MFNLIITVVAIALFSAITLASINYLPWWQKASEDVFHASRKSMLNLESAFNAKARAENGVIPAPLSGEEDGGLMSAFGSILKFRPAAPGGYHWVYGQRSTVDGTVYEGMHYFCLTSVTPGGGMTREVYRGALLAKAVFSSQQVFFGENCGDTYNSKTPSTYPAPVSLTFFVTYSPALLD